MGMKTCAVCAAEVDEAARSCDRCGAGFADQLPPPPPGGWGGQQQGWGGEQQGWGGSPQGGSGWSPQGTASATDQRNLGMLSHLSAFVALVGVPSFVGPLIMWLVKREDPYVAPHAAEALNFQISILIWSIVGGLVGVVLGVVTLGIGLLILVPIAIALAIAWFVVVIMGAVAASRGEAFRYPLTIRFVR
jgi:uncharacterized protein